MYDILRIGSKAYEITYNITKKGRVAARPFSCLFFCPITPDYRYFNECKKIPHLEV